MVIIVLWMKGKRVQKGVKWQHAEEMISHAAALVLKSKHNNGAHLLSGRGGGALSQQSEVKVLDRFIRRRKSPSCQS